MEEFNVELPVLDWLLRVAFDEAVEFAATEEELEV